MIKNIDENVNLDSFEDYCDNRSSSNIKITPNSIFLRIDILLDAEFGHNKVVTYDMVFKYLTDGWIPNKSEERIVQFIVSRYISFLEKSCCRPEYSIMSFYMLDKISLALSPAQDLIFNLRKIYKHNLNANIYIQMILYIYAVKSLR